MEKDFKVTLDGNELNVFLGRELSIGNATSLTEELTKYVGQDIERIIFDATGLTYLSSSGIRSLLVAYQDLGNQPEIVFVNCAKVIYDVLDLVGMTSIIKFKEDQEKREEYRQNVLYDLSIRDVSKLSSDRNSELEQFAANNDVVCYTMKLGQEDE